MNRFLKTTISILLASVMLVGCGGNSNSNNTEGSATDVADPISVGFSQLGAESDWRSANTESMKSTLTVGKGYELLFEDGQQKQANQITAIRSFIQQGVDYIVLAPVSESGWDSVLSEAKSANIPVIIVDRQVAVEDDSLFTCWVGSDFLLEGRKAAEWLHCYLYKNKISNKDVHIVDIQGTLDSSAQLGRTQGLEEAVAKYGWDLREKTCGEFTQAKGREAMAAMLRKYNNINVVYCENDNEALGAIEAIEAAGKKAGSDILNGEIMVISFDGVNENAIRYCLDGTISCIVECNPLHGPRVESIISSLQAGDTPDKLEYVSETVYSSLEDVSQVNVNGSIYGVTLLTQDVIDSRPY